MFAHCERSNTIMLWRWMGATKPTQPVVAAVASFKLPAYWKVPIWGTSWIKPCTRFSVCATCIVMAKKAKKLGYVM
jgi:hypothetical protein